MTDIAFIGLGNMGGPMARNLVKAGHAVTGFDQYANCLQEASRHGVSASTSNESAVASAEVVITMLPDGQHVRDMGFQVRHESWRCAFMFQLNEVSIDR